MSRLPGRSLAHDVPHIMFDLRRSCMPSEQHPKRKSRMLTWRILDYYPTNGSAYLGGAKTGQRRKVATIWEALNLAIDAAKGGAA